MQPRIREIPIERVPPSWTNGGGGDAGAPSDSRYRADRTILPGVVYSPPSTLPSNRTVFPQTQKRHMRPHNFQNQQLITGDPTIPRISPSSTVSFHGPTPNSSISSSASLRFRNFGTSQDSLRRQKSPETSGISGFKTVATYGLADQPHSTASTPSGAPTTRHISPQPVPTFVSEPRGTRSGSLPHPSQTALLPSHYLRYRPAAAALPVMQPEFPSQVPPRDHHTHHVQAVPAEIVATGIEEDPEVAADRAEPDYHLVESGSDVQLAQRAHAHVPEPAPRDDGRPSGSNGRETDILDSSCSSSDTEDDVVRNCDGESEGNAPGLKYDAQSVGTSSDEMDDRELQELIERQTIVEKYEAGPEGHDVDPWENPDFELYKVTDRYGFVHRSETDAEAQALQHQRNLIKKELQREGKWLRMLEEWDTRHPAKLPERIWKGVPEKLRAVVWQRMLGIDKFRKDAEPKTYENLLMRARLLSMDIRQIDLDINRTYRDHLAFRRRYDSKQQSLFCVLSAYAMYNTEVGYCQGMSQIAGLFLMYMNEEDAFWCLHSLMVNRKYSMHGMFAPGFPKLHRFEQHYDRVMQRYLPKLHKHFDREGVVPSYLTKWWFGCFLDRVPFPLALRIWDVFLYYGDSILIAMAFNIMDLHQKTLKKLPMEKCLDFIQSDLARDFGYSFDHTMQALEKCLKRLQSDKMALPPFPADSKPELPTKPLGPVLTRSMVDIRQDISEVQSRSSRANSIHGKSPAVRRRGKNPPSPSPAPNRRAKPPTPSPLVNGNHPHAHANGNSPSSPSNGELNGHAQAEGVHSADHHHSTGLRKPLVPLKPVIPDSDGFVPMSPRRKDTGASASRTSTYDNVPAQSDPAVDVNVFGYGSHFRTASGRSNDFRHSRESSADRVRHGANNVTYVAVGDDEPHIPVPDYDGALTANSLTRSEKLARTASAYQHRRVHGTAGPAAAPGRTPSRSPNRQANHASLKQRSPQLPTNRYYFEADPPGRILPQVPVSSNMSSGAPPPSTTRNKNSYL